MHVTHATDLPPHQLFTTPSVLGDQAGVGEDGDVPVEAGRRHVGQQLVQLSGGQHAVAEERLDDAQPDRVEQQVGGRHESPFSILTTFLVLGMILSWRPCS